MRDYELVYILDPDLSEEVVTERMERFRSLAASQGAEIKSQERWEKRRLAYEIKDKREGVYVVMELNSLPACVNEMDRILKITDGVLRHLIVRAPEGKAISGVITSPPPVLEFEPVRSVPPSIEAPEASPAAGVETHVEPPAEEPASEAEDGAESETTDREPAVDEAAEPAAAPTA